MIRVSFEKRRDMLVLSNLLLIVLLGLLIATKLITTNFEFYPYPAMAVLTIVIGNLIYLRLGGDLRLSQKIMMAVLTLGYLAAVYNTGGYDGAAVFLAPILPMLTFLWFDNKAGCRMLMGLLVTLVVLFVAQINGMVPANQLNEVGLLMTRLISIGSVTICCTWITWAFNESSEVQVFRNQTQATTDHLTQLANRRALDIALLREAGRARRDQSWLSFVMIDVDHFKLYNDKNGHQAGDASLILIAKLIDENVQRPGDLAGRFGGEEFALILPNTNSEGAYHLAERIRLAMEKLELSYYQGSQENVTITLGVISIEGSQIHSIDRVVKEADAALYRGKVAGRNRVITQTIEMPVNNATEMAV